MAEKSTPDIDAELVQIRHEILQGFQGDCRFGVLEGSGTFRDLNDEEKGKLGIKEEPFERTPPVARTIPLQNHPGWSLVFPGE